VVTTVLSTYPVLLHNPSITGLCGIDADDFVVHAGSARITLTNPSPWFSEELVNRLHLRTRSGPTLVVSIASGENLLVNGCDIWAPTGKKIDVAYQGPSRVSRVEASMVPQSIFDEILRAKPNDMKKEEDKSKDGVKSPNISAGESERDDDEAPRNELAMYHTPDVTFNTDYTRATIQRCTPGSEYIRVIELATDTLGKVTLTAGNDDYLHVVNDEIRAPRGSRICVDIASDSKKTSNGDESKSVIEASESEEEASESEEEASESDEEASVVVVAERVKACGWTATLVNPSRRFVETHTKKLLVLTPNEKVELSCKDGDPDEHLVLKVDTVYAVRATPITVARTQQACPLATALLGIFFYNETTQTTARCCTSLFHYELAGGIDCYWGGAASITSFTVRTFK
jgi:hypothetical protein